MLHGWIGIGIGIALVVIGFFTSIWHLPNKSEKNPDVTLTHLRYWYLESFMLILGGLFIVVLSLLLLTFYL